MQFFSIKVEDNDIKRKDIENLLLNSNNISLKKAIVFGKE